MADVDIPLPMVAQHPVWPKNGDCLFGPWYPKDKRTSRRVCVHPDCTNAEERVETG